MKLSYQAAILSLFLLAGSALAVGQQKIDADDSDVAALLQQVNLAHQQQHPELRSGTDYEKRCDKGKGYGSEGPSEICFNAWASHRTNTEILLLKGCSYSPDGPPKKNPCEFLAEFYLQQGRYIEGLAALRLPNAAQADEGRYSDTKLELYGKLGNRAKQKAEVTHQCHDLADDLSCQILNEEYGGHVNMEDAHNRAADREEQNKADDAQRQADGEQQRSEKAANRAALLDAISSIGATPQATSERPVYGAPAQPSRPASSSSSDNPPRLSQGCRNMNACVRVVSSNYDANHFLHVVVRNSCDSEIRVTTSVYAQNRSCTVGQTSNIAPGDTIDLGAQTDRNWYRTQADDSVRSGYDGSGCKLIIPGSCN